MLKAVLFDMDGVLVDTEPEYIKQELNMAKDLGIPLTEQEQGNYAGIHPLEMWMDLQNKYGFLQDPYELSKIEAQWMDDYYENGILRPNESAIQFLKNCVNEGLKVAVATSSIKENAQKVIQRIGIGEYVDIISSGCMAGKSKPAPDIFLLAAKLLGVEPDECIVIEDAKSGVQAAKRAGMKAIGLQSAVNHKDLSLATMVVGSLSDISVDTLYTL